MNGLLVFLIIVAIAIWIKSGKRPSAPGNASKGWLIGLLLVVLVGLGWWFVHREPKEEPAKPTVVYIPASPTSSPEPPTSGEGFATKAKPIRVWIDPRKTHTRGSGPAHYVFESRPTTTFDDYFDGRRDKEWWNYPAGWYLVTPIKGDEIFFRWWQ